MAVDAFHRHLTGWRHQTGEVAKTYFSRTEGGSREQRHRRRLRRRNRTLPMTVHNTGFMLDRLGKDGSPLQFLRELTQNSIEAMVDTPEGQGEVTWDVDWNRWELTGIYKLACIDTGVGMTGEEMLRYINMLSSSTHIQSHEANYGVGAKVAAATRNHAGLIYVSWKDGVG
jgi:hypothetical protein